MSESINGFFSIIRTALLAFGGVAVLVGAFLIFNTFSITVGQRLREFAMLRTLGASRRQVMWSVIGEALIMGVVASVVGLFGGMGLAKLLNQLFKAIGADIPTAGIGLQTRTVVVALAVGIGITVRGGAAAGAARHPRAADGGPARGRRDADFAARLATCPTLPRWSRSRASRLLVVGVTGDGAVRTS